jgi:hypothetical protein
MSFKTDLLENLFKLTHSGITLVAAGALTDQQAVEVDLSELIMQKDFLMSVSMKIQAGATAPGAANLTFNLYWSDVKLPAATDAPAKLSGRKTAVGSLAVPTTNNDFKYYEVYAANRPKARFLYLTIDKPVLTQAVTFDAQVNLIAGSE